MSKRQGKKLLGTQESINKALERIDMRQQGRAVTEFKACRRCDKRVEAQFMRKGFCMACINKAKAIKAERERLAKLERDAMKIYDNDSNFGAF